MVITNKEKDEEIRFKINDSVSLLLNIPIPTFLKINGFRFRIKCIVSADIFFEITPTISATKISIQVQLQCDHRVKQPPS